MPEDDDWIADHDFQGAPAVKCMNLAAAAQEEPEFQDRLYLGQGRGLPVLIDPCEPMLKPLAVIPEQSDAPHEDNQDSAEAIADLRQERPQHDVDSNSRRRIYLRNITRWGPKAVKFLKDYSKLYDMIGFVETHMPSDRSEELVNAVHDLGYKVALTPARRKKDVESSGGCMLAARAQHQVTSFRHLAMSEDQMIGTRSVGPFVAGPLDFWDFVPLCMRLKGLNLTYVASYLDTQKEGAPLSANNKIKLALLGGFIKAVKGLWCIAGDWNLTPEELARTGWLEQIGGTIIRPSNVSFTSFGGTGRLLDYAVVALGTDWFFLDLVADESQTWSSHLGIDITIDAQPVMAPVRTLRMPKSFAHPPLPPKAPDPLSKRTAMRAEWADLHGGRIAAAIAAQDKRSTAKYTALQEVRNARKMGLPPPPGTLTVVGPAVQLFNGDDALDLNDGNERDWQEECEPFPEGPEDLMDSVVDLQSLENLADHAPETPALTSAAAAETIVAAKADIAAIVAPHVRNAIWRLTSIPSSTDKLPLNGKTPPYVALSAAYQADPLAAERTGIVYASWTSRLEQFYCAEYCIPQADRRPFLGRHTLPDLVMVNPKAEPMEDMIEVGPDEWWASAARNLALLARMKAGNKAAPSKIHAQEKKISDISVSLGPGSDPPLTPLALTQWKTALRNIAGSSVHRVKELSDAAQSNRTKAERAAVARSLKAFVQWFDTAASEGYGKLHKAVKDRRHDPDEFIVHGKVGSSRTTASPLELIKHKRQVWAEKWRHEDEHPQDLWLFLEEAKAKARTQTTKNITPRRLEQVLAEEAAGKSRGLAQISLQDVKRLPSEGKLQLIEFYDAVETQLSWPWQLIAIAVALIPKKGGDRGLGVMPWLIRLWSRLRSDTIGDWADETADPWDQAVAGSSSLRRAMCRSFMDEAAATLGLHTVSTLWDVKEFFDSLDITKVLRFALDNFFPATELVLLTLCHLAPRLLRSNGCYADPIQPHRSAIAGCRGAQQFARLVMKQVLHFVHWRHFPAVISKSWVDDVNQRSEATQPLVRERLVAAAVDFAAEVQAMGLTIADKSRVIASSQELAEQIASDIRDMGFNITAADVSPDLGIDRGHATWRSKPTARARLLLSSRRTGKVIRLAKAANRWKGGRHLFKTGVAPQACYHAKVHGMPPSTVLSVRRGASAACAPKRNGRCLTALLAIEYGKEDPAVSIPVGLFREWFALMADSSYHMRAEAAWDTILGDLSINAKSRWRKIAGPTHAVIATLLDLEWTPLTSRCWISADGVEWSVALSDNDTGATWDPSDFLDCIADAAAKQLWSRAANHYNGQGLENGADMYGLRLHVKELRKQGKHDIAGALVCAATAAAWTRQRIADLPKTTTPAAASLFQTPSASTHTASVNLPGARAGATPASSSLADPAPSTAAVVTLSASQLEFREWEDSLVSGIAAEGPATANVTPAEPCANADVTMSSDPDAALCKRCGKAPETDYHRIWDCDANRNLKACKKSANLVQKAKFGHKILPCLWLRGIVPATWTTDQIPSPPDTAEPVVEDLGASFGPSGKLITGGNDRLLGCGDGSGGEKSADPRLRRVGWAWVLLKSHLAECASDIVYTKTSVLAGRRRTVNRSELAALVDFAASTEGAATFVTDSSYVMAGVSKIKRSGLKGKRAKHKFNADLWADLTALLTGRDFSVEKVESHLDVDDDSKWAGIYPKSWVFGNSWADLFAGGAADDAALPSSIIASIEWIDDISQQIRTRIAETLIDAAEKDPRPPRTPTPKKVIAVGTARRKREEARRRNLAATQHTVSSDKQHVTCRVCGITPLAKDVDAWLQTACAAPLMRPFCPDVAAPSEGAPVKVGLNEIHPSHCPSFAVKLGLWFCSTCGATGRKFLRGLAQPCVPKTRSGTESLARVARSSARKPAQRAPYRVDSASSSTAPLRLRRLTIKQKPPPEYVTAEAGLLADSAPPAARRALVKQTRRPAHRRLVVTARGPSSPPPSLVDSDAQWTSKELAAVSAERARAKSDTDDSSSASSGDADAGDNSSQDNAAAAPPNSSCALCAVEDFAALAETAPATSATSLPLEGTAIARIVTAAAAAAAAEATAAEEAVEASALSAAEELESEFSSLRDLMELHSDGFKVTWPGSHNLATARLRLAEITAMRR